MRVANTNIIIIIIIKIYRALLTALAFYSPNQISGALASEMYFMYLNGAFTLVAVSVDRHRAIRHPLRPRLTRRQLIGALAVIWTAALGLSLPVAALSRVVRLTTTSDNGID